MLETKHSFRVEDNRLSLFNNTTPILTGLDLSSLISTPYYGNVKVNGVNIDLQYDPIFDVVNVEPNTGWINEFIDDAKNSWSHITNFELVAHNRMDGSVSGDVIMKPVANFNINAGWIDSENNNWLKLGYIKANKFRILPNNFFGNHKHFNMRLDRGVGWPKKHEQIVELNNSNIHIEYRGGKFTRTASLPDKHADGYWNQGYLFYLRGNNNRVVIDFFEGIGDTFPIRDTNGTEKFSMFNFEGSNNLVIVNILNSLKFGAGWISSDTYHTMFSAVRSVRYSGNLFHSYETGFSGNTFVFNVQPDSGLELPYAGPGSNGQIHMFSGHMKRYSINVLKYGNSNFSPGHWFHWD